MEEIKYYQPKSMNKLADVLQKATNQTAILAGGTDLLIKIRNRHPELDAYISLIKIKDLKEIYEENGFLRIGACATHDEIANNKQVNKDVTALSMACAHVGSQQIRNKGTIGGSIANASAAGDMLPCIFLFNGQIEIYTKEKESVFLPIQEFYQGIGKIKLKIGEIIRAIWIPIKKEKSCFVKLGSRKDVTIAEISLALAWNKSENERLVRGYLGAVGEKPVFVEECGTYLKGALDKNSLDELAFIMGEKIRTIRKNRKRPPKLRITEEERLYKERAVKGVVYDAVEYMREDS